MRRPRAGAFAFESRSSAAVPPTRPTAVAMSSIPRTGAGAMHGEHTCAGLRNSRTPGVNDLRADAMCAFIDAAQSDDEVVPLYARDIVVHSARPSGTESNEIFTRSGIAGRGVTERGWSDVHLLAELGLVLGEFVYIMRAYQSTPAGAPSNRDADNDDNKGNDWIETTDYECDHSEWARFVPFADSRRAADALSERLPEGNTSPKVLLALVLQLWRCVYHNTGPTRRLQQREAQCYLDRVAAKRMAIIAERNRRLAASLVLAYGPDVSAACRAVGPQQAATDAAIAGRLLSPDGGRPVYHEQPIVGDGLCLYRSLASGLFARATGHNLGRGVGLDRGGPLGFLAAMDAGYTGFVGAGNRDGDPVQFAALAGVILDGIALWVKFYIYVLLCTSVPARAVGYLRGVRFSGSLGSLPSLSHIGIIDDPLALVHNPEGEARRISDGASMPTLDCIVRYAAWLLVRVQDRIVASPLASPLTWGEARTLCAPLMAARFRWAADSPLASPPTLPADKGPLWVYEPSAGRANHWHETSLMVVLTSSDDYALGDVNVPGQSHAADENARYRAYCAMMQRFTTFGGQGEIAAFSHILRDLDAYAPSALPSPATLPRTRLPTSGTRSATSDTRSPMLDTPTLAIWLGERFSFRTGVVYMSAQLPRELTDAVGHRPCFGAAKPRAESDADPWTAERQLTVMYVGQHYTALLPPLLPLAHAQMLALAELGAPALPIEATSPHTSPTRQPAPSPRASPSPQHATPSSVCGPIPSLPTTPPSLSSMGDWASSPTSWTPRSSADDSAEHDGEDTTEGVLSDEEYAQREGSPGAYADYENDLANEYDRELHPRTGRIYMLGSDGHGDSDEEREMRLAEENEARMTALFIHGSLDEHNYGRDNNDNDSTMDRGSRRAREPSKREISPTAVQTNSSRPVQKRARIGSPAARSTAMHTPSPIRSFRAARGSPPYDESP